MQRLRQENELLRENVRSHTRTAINKQRDATEKQQLAQEVHQIRAQDKHLAEAVSRGQAVLPESARYPAKAMTSRYPDKQEKEKEHLKQEVQRLRVEDEHLTEVVGRAEAKLSGTKALKEERVRLEQEVKQLRSENKQLREEADIWSSDTTQQPITTSLLRVSTAPSASSGLESESASERVWNQGSALKSSSESQYGSQSLPSSSAATAAAEALGGDSPLPDKLVQTSTSPLMRTTSISSGEDPTTASISTSILAIKSPGLHDDTPLLGPAALGCIVCLAGLGVVWLLCSNKGSSYASFNGESTRTVRTSGRPEPLDDSVHTPLSAGDDQSVAGTSNPSTPSSPALRFAGHAYRGTTSPGLVRYAPVDAPGLISVGMTMGSYQEDRSGIRRGWQSGARL